MPAFDELIRNLLLSGMNGREVVVQLERALDASAPKSALADDLESVKEWAVHAGWEPSEIDRVLVTLSEVFQARFRSPEA